MKSLKNILLGGLVLASLNGFGQAFGYYNDALRFSQTNAFGSTARIQGIGGSQIALGGDISSAGSNPAGLGFFNRSAFSFSPTVTFHNSDGIYGDNIVPAYKANFNLPNFGIVLNHTIGDIPDNKFKGGSFAISVTRINDFNQEMAYEGYSSYSSIVDAFAANAGITEPNSLPDLEYAAWESYLIDPIYDNNDNLQEYTINIGVEPFQSERITTSGGQNQINFSWGGNYDDKLYFGAGLGIQTLNYKKERFYSESDFIYYQDGAAYSDDRVNYIALKDQYTISGAGVNGTFGLIVRPVPIVTLGVSYITPTYFSLRDESKFTLDPLWNNYQYDEETVLNEETVPPYRSNLVISEYNLKTPGKLNLGAALFIGKYGFLTGDVEFVDYTAAQFQSSTAELNLNADNQEIINTYKNVFNYRFGAEARMDIFRFRAGYNYMADPYRSPDKGKDNSRQNLTFGVGLRQKDFYVDLALVKTFYNEYYSPYFLPTVEDQPQVTFDHNNTTIAATVGFTF